MTTAHPAARVAALGLRQGGRHAEWRAVPPAYIALDVDGTLVREGQVPDARTLRAIERAVAAGIHVGLATGRMAAAAEELLATGALTGPHVFHNGAVVTDGQGSERVVLGLSDDEVAAVLALGRERDDVSVEVYVGRTYLTDRTDVRADPHARLLGHRPSGTIARVADLGGQPAIKAVVVCFGPEAAQGVVGALTRVGLAAGPAASPATPELRYVNVTRAGVDKGSGVAAAAELIGIPLGAVAALGDETNDLPVLARVGTAVAMGGSAPELLRGAHLVAPPFDGHGAAATLDALTDLVSSGPGQGEPGQREPGTW